MDFSLWMSLHNPKSHLDLRLLSLPVFWCQVFCLTSMTTLFVVLLSVWLYFVRHTLHFTANAVKLLYVLPPDYLQNFENWHQNNLDGWCLGELSFWMSPTSGEEIISTDVHDICMSTYFWPSQKSLICYCAFALTGLPPSHAGSLFWPKLIKFTTRFTLCDSAVTADSLIADLFNSLLL